MMFDIHKLQGTADVVNYAGYVRAASQRLVKLEIAGNQYDQLIKELDDIHQSLQQGGGDHQLISLDDSLFKDRLATQCDYWDEVRDELANVRMFGAEKSDIVNVSEIYFHLADETVDAAAAYTDRLTKKLRYIETATIAVMAVLLLFLLNDTLQHVRIIRENQILKKKAYIDLHTGLPNKSRCEELLGDVSFVNKATACLVFDLNNLKSVNDTLGHSAGDQLILNFARELRNAVPPRHIVARYGGDEFLVVAQDVTPGAVESILQQVADSINRFNKNSGGTAISYACGWAHSEQYLHCSLKTLFDRADKSMYDNKIKCRELL